MAILQKTLNDHVNAEAITVWVDVMPEMADRIALDAWPDDPNLKERAAMAALHSATSLMRDAIAAALEARRLADDVAYDRLYGRRERVHGRLPALQGEETA